jgi:hypothetical protein
VQHELPVHFQVGPKEFAKLYNLAQAITAPVLAVAVNSPVLLQHRLWHETRIALFQQSLDTRSGAHDRARPAPARQLRRALGRREHPRDLPRGRRALPLADRDRVDENPMRCSPKVACRSSALRLHNGTVYRWNRPATASATASRTCASKTA